MEPDLTFESGTALAAGIRARAFTSSDLVTRFLARIDRYDGPLHAVVTRDDDAALAHARAADDAIRAGAPVGPLHGVPMTIKDAVRVAGWRSTYGLPLFKAYVPRADSEVVRRLRAAGAVVIGRTNVPFASFDWQCKGPLFPEGKNPWDPTRTPGGSSGGAAAALCARFTPLELGSDIAGSMRVPASFCGVLGLRPTDGALPSDDVAPEGTKGFSHFATPGPMARTLEDLRLLFDVLSNAPPAPPSTESVPSRLRIAFTGSLAGVTPDGACRAALDALKEALKRDGHDVDRPSPDTIDFEHAYRTWGIVAGHEYVGSLPPRFRSRLGRAVVDAYMLRWRLGDGPLAQYFREGLNSDRDAYERALDDVRGTRAAIDRFFEDTDLWILPAAPTVAIRRQLRGSDLTLDGESIAYSRLLGAHQCPTAVLGTPALALPIATGDGGLPLGIQVHAARGADARLLSIAQRHLASYVKVGTPPLA